MFKDIKPCQSIEESITMTSYQIKKIIAMNSDLNQKKISNRNSAAKL